MTNSELIFRRDAAVARSLASAYPIFVERAENSILWDADGKSFIDFAGGIAVLNTGHRHPKVLAAAIRQIEAYTHTAFQILPYEPYVALAERLNALAPIDGPAKSVFFSTGAEAVENAIKIARAATGRAGVIAFAGGFHGRTHLAMSLTGKVSPYRDQFGVGPAGIFHVPFPCEADSVSVEESLKALERLFRADISPADVAAIIIEPVQGEGGFHSAPEALLAELRQLADQHGIVLIADEIQTGFGRTGKMFAMEHSTVRPDLITVAKSLAGGFPLSGVIGRADLMDQASPGSLGGTYSGNPVACAAALAVLDVIEDEFLLERASLIGNRIRDRLESYIANEAGRRIVGLRGPGAMIAFDIIDANGQPDAAAAKAVAHHALELGLVILTCGIFGNTIRILVPLTVPDDQLDDGLTRLGVALGKED
ncbi:4-aminobutyrate--2-oxoglutarate transaminase [Pelagibacterium sp.]|uniref:4-aminobutyrate--2-oxoglutarate transaminase n=1 Tax=Pelagibacterium sp. TaxID=1967288 RepID=UPI003A8FF32F